MLIACAKGCSMIHYCNQNYHLTGKYSTMTYLICIQPIRTTCDVWILGIPCWNMKIWWHLQYQRWSISIQTWDLILIRLLLMRCTITREPPKKLSMPNKWIDTILPTELLTLTFSNGKKNFPWMKFAMLKKIVMNSCKKLDT